MMPHPMPGAVFAFCRFEATIRKSHINLMDKCGSMYKSVDVFAFCYATPNAEGLFFAFFAMDIIIFFLENMI